MEYIVVVDPIGGGMSNMCITDEKVIRCRNCGRTDKTNENELVCKKHYPIHFRVDPDGFCSDAIEQAQTD